MKLYRLSGRKVCERVKTKGFLWKGKHLFARYLLGLPRNYPAVSPAGIYVGFLTSTKLHKSAVKRNRMRRRCREALRIALNSLDQPSFVSETSVIERAREAAGLAGPAAGALLMRKGGSAGGTPVVALPRNVQLLLLPRSSSLECNFEELSQDIDRLLLHLHPRARHA